jgi:hypothetical protein
MHETNASDLSFPIYYSEQARFLKLAEDFLALETSSDESNVIPIDSAEARDLTESRKRHNREQAVGFDGFGIGC